jgi:serine/threonine protein kinase
VMEYIEGQSLQKLLVREHRTLPLSTALQLAQEIAEALHYAHSCCQWILRSTSW